MVDPKLQERFIELRADGMSFSAIGKKLGIAKGTVLKWNKELRREIGELTAVRMETIKTKYKLTQSHQVERYGTWLKQIDTELARRDWKDVRTDQLLAMAIKITSELRIYVPPPKEPDEDYKAFTVDELEAISRGDYEVVS